MLHRLKARSFLDVMQHAWSDVCLRLRRRRDCHGHIVAAVMFCIDHVSGLADGEGVS